MRAWTGQACRSGRRAPMHEVDASVPYGLDHCRQLARVERAVAVHERDDVGVGGAQTRPSMRRRSHGGVRSTTLAPSSRATELDPSVEPLSTTMARQPVGIRPSTQGSASTSSRTGSTTSTRCALTGATRSSRAIQRPAGWSHPVMTKSASAAKVGEAIGRHPGPGEPGPLLVGRLEPGLGQLGRRAGRVGLDQHRAAFVEELDRCAAAGAPGRRRCRCCRRAAGLCASVLPRGAGRRRSGRAPDPPRATGLVGGGGRRIDRRA